MKLAITIIVLVLMVSCGNKATNPEPSITQENNHIPATKAAVKGFWYQGIRVEHQELYIGGIKTSTWDTSYTEYFYGLHNGVPMYMELFTDSVWHDYCGLTTTISGFKQSDCIGGVYGLDSLDFIVGTAAYNEYQGHFPDTTYDTIPGNYSVGVSYESYIKNNEWFRTWKGNVVRGDRVTKHIGTDVFEKYTGPFPPSGWPQTFCP